MGDSRIRAYKDGENTGFCNCMKLFMAGAGDYKERHPKRLNEYKVMGMLRCKAKTNSIRIDGEEISMHHLYYLTTEIPDSPTTRRRRRLARTMRRYRAMRRYRY